LKLHVTDNHKSELNAEGFCERVYQKYQLLCELGDAYADAERYDAAVSVLNEAIRQQPRFAEAHASMGMILLRQGDLKEAAREFDAAHASNPNNAVACRGMGMVSQRIGQYPRAFEMYLRALELDADDLLSLLGLFQTSCKMGTFSKITQYLETYLGNHPDDTSVIFCLATLYAKEGRLEDARDQLMTLLTVEPGKEEAIQMLEKVQQHIRKRAAADVPAKAMRA
jgi:tetratricopeptide (TPR) repeat protein